MRIAVYDESDPFDKRLSQRADNDHRDVGAAIDDLSEVRLEARHEIDLVDTDVDDLADCASVDRLAVCPVQVSRRERDVDAEPEGVDRLNRLLEDQPRPEQARRLVR